MALTTRGRRRKQKACGTKRKGKRGGNILGRGIVPFALLALNQFGQRHKRRSLRGKSQKRSSSRRSSRR